jgi:hypothetical protein
VIPAKRRWVRVVLLWTEQERSWPQLTVETGGAVRVRVNVAELWEDPVGEPVIVRMYVPAGTMLVVEIVRAEVAPFEVGVMLVGEKAIMPHGLGPELT